MGRPRKQGKRTKSGRLSRAEGAQGPAEDVRDVVLQARRRRLSAALLEANVEIWRESVTAPMSRAEKARLSLAGDRLFELEMDGELHPEQVAAGHDFAARYQRWVITQGLPRRTAKVASYGSVSGMPFDHDEEACQRARDAHMRDLEAIRAYALGGAIQHLFAAVVEDRYAAPAMLRSALDALIRLHRGDRKK